MNPDDLDRPLRKDAARNRELLLEAARRVFAERGLEASLDDIARAAGVGVGTAYRHFANKQELAAALFTQHTEQMIADAEAALAIEDPWQALVSYFEGAAQVQAHDRGLHQVLMGIYPISLSESVQERLAAPITALFDRAEAACVLRPGVHATDAGIVFAILGTLFEMSEATETELWRRWLAIILDGLRASDRGPLPAPPLSFDQVQTAMLATKK